MKVGVVGAGMVGATAAYAMVMHGVGREIVLVDRSMARAEAEADDISHAIPFSHPLTVRAGDYPDLAGAVAVIIAAGVAQQGDETRASLLGRNAQVFKSVIPQVIEFAPEAVLVVATNPVDVMTHVAHSIAVEHGLPGSRVLGTGTMLDTARFRMLLAAQVGVDAQHVHAYVLGEHGDTEVLGWSAANVAGQPLTEFCADRGVDMGDDLRSRIHDAVCNAAYRIISGKGATYYGVGSAISHVIDTVISDRRAVLTVCAPAAEILGVRDVTLSLPRLVGGAGVLDTFAPELDALEVTALQASASAVRAAIDSMTADGF